jgi:DNA replication regulator SLD3
MNEYIAFLESLILSTPIIDKKYKDGVPECVSLIDIHDHSADDANQVARTKKRKSSKKMKPGKTGLYPLEDTLIRKWWASHDDEADSGGPGVSLEEITKRRISQLRMRETQLQMIIILEILALQPLATSSENTGDGLPSALQTGMSGNEKERATKPTKPDRLTMLIDVHIDRLSIWQSLLLEAVQTPIDDISNLSESEKVSNLPKHADTILRDFCVEIIIPLYVSHHWGYPNSSDNLQLLRPSP